MWNCFGSLENYCETESFGFLVGWMCEGGCCDKGWCEDQLWEGQRYPMKLPRLQTDCMSALVIMGHLRNPKSVISRLWGEPCLLRSWCFFGPVALGLSVKLRVHTDLYSHQFLPSSTQQMVMVHLLWTWGTASHHL